MKRRIWAGAGVMFTMLVVVGSLSFLLYLRDQTSEELAESGPRVSAKAPPQADISVPQPDLAPTPESTESNVNIAAPGRRGTSPTDNDRLQSLRDEFDYDPNGAENSEDAGLLWGIRADQPRVVEAMIQWFYEDPAAFVDLAAEEEDDQYIQAVLRSQINPSNVYLLSERFHIRNRHLINLAYENQLHIQQPELFIEVFDQFAGSDMISVPASVVAATAESDYWGHRDELIDLAIHTREPEIYFDALAQQGRDDMFDLARQMWSVHVADDYPEVMTTGTGYVERIRLAYRYGVADAPQAIAELQARGLFVDETISRYTDVPDSAGSFQTIYPELVYQPDRMRWTHPQLTEASE